MAVWIISTEKMHLNKLSVPPGYKIDLFASEKEFVGLSQSGSDVIR
ncbi:MAG: hypothetical protein U5K54_19530 [Cytophagales bacterium]|nr:hypothetical protein [Cytophagales bacterium]